MKNWVKSVALSFLLAAIVANAAWAQTFTAAVNRTEVPQGETFVLNDVPLSFGLRKKYQDRQVTLVPAKNCEEIEALE